MTRLQKLQLEQSEIRQKIGESLDIPEDDRPATYAADLDKLTKRALALEVEMRAAVVAGEETAEETAEETTTETTEEDAEARELRELEERVEFAPYVRAAVRGRGVDGAELEYNAALGMDADRFPLELLTRDLDAELETRAAIDGDGRTNQGSWIDRLFADTAAQRLGITMPSVGAGVSAYPVITSDAAPAQRGRTEAAGAATISATVTEIKPTRASVHAVYSIEDDARLPGLADAIMRDLRGAMVEKVDRNIFVGDDGANEAAADIAGLTTATGITELTLTQANKVKADEILKVLLGLVDGVYAASLDDVRIVASVGLESALGRHDPRADSIQPDRRPVPAGERRVLDHARHYRDGNDRRQVRRIRRAPAWHPQRRGSSGVGSGAAREGHLHGRQVRRGTAHPSLSLGIPDSPSGQLPPAQVCELGALSGAERLPGFPGVSPARAHPGGALRLREHCNPGGPRYGPQGIVRAAGLPLRPRGP